MKKMCVDNGDIFGPSRTYTTRQYSSNNRPSMISPKYRQKEERRKVLKTSINKLRKIDDPEASLCRSVLINNTMKKLQDEARNEKLQKQQMNRPVSDDNNHHHNMTRKIVGNHVPNSNLTKIQSASLAVVENVADSKQTEKSDVSVEDEMLLNTLEEISNCTNASSPSESVSPETTGNTSRVASRKRSFSDLDDCNVQDVLSHFYVPPTPTMITCIEEYDDIVVDNLSKRMKPDIMEQSSDSRTISPIDSALSNFSADNLTNKNVPAKISRLRHFSQTDSDSNSFGCGHAFMFGEFRNNTYQNLITSLES